MKKVYPDSCCHMFTISRAQNPAPKSGRALLGVTTVTAERMPKKCSWLSRNNHRTGTMNGKALLFEILEPYRNMWPSLSEPLEMTIIGNLIRDVIIEASKPTTVRYVSNSWRSKLQNPFDAGKLLSSDSSKLGIPKCAISVPRFFDEAAYEPWPFNTKYDIAVLVGKIPTEEVSPVEKQSLDRFVGQYSPGDKKRCVGSLKHWQNTLADTLWETLEGI